MDGDPDYFEGHYSDFESYSDLDGDNNNDYWDYDRDGDGINTGYGQSAILKKLLNT